MQQPRPTPLRGLALRDQALARHRSLAPQPAAGRKGPPLETRALLMHCRWRRVVVVVVAPHVYPLAPPAMQGL
jgi:hypothetical protein